MSRFDATPETLEFRLDEDAYTVVDLAGVREAGELERVAEALAGVDEPATREEVAKLVELTSSTAGRRLTSLVELGRAAKTGAGRKGDPFRYALAGASEGGGAS